MQAVFTEWLEYDFMKNALLAVLIITPLFGILGTMIVNKKNGIFLRFIRTFRIDRNCDRSRAWNEGYDTFHDPFCNRICAAFK